MVLPSPLHVLIVDDSATDCVIFRRHLTRGTSIPCEISEAATAALAMEQLALQKPHCVLLDFNLPDSDGLGLVRKIVSVYGPNAFGIVMLTSNHEVELAVEAMQSGAHDFLPKAVTNAIVLRRAVDNAAEKAAIQRELESQRLAVAQKNNELEVHVRKLEAEVGERLLAEDRLRQSEQQLRVVTDHAAVLLAHYDCDYRYKFVNRPYAERVGLRPEQLIGKKIQEVLSQQTFEQLQPYFNAILSGERERVEFEIEIPYRSLGPRWMSVVYVPDHGMDCSVQGLIGVMSDTTSRKSAEMDLEHARDEALAASRAKDDFLAALSHELRTPLNPILLLSSDAASNPAFPAPVRSVFETIRKSVELEAHLIDDLLNITRISRGKMALVKQPQDVHAVLVDALATVASEIDTKHLSLSQQFKAQAFTVMGDAVRLQQIFWNVLKNAVKFTSEGGRITIATRTLYEEDVIEISITDTGIGMSESELSRIFEAFAQGDHAGVGGSHRFGGLGLGLAISLMLVESHSGFISAHSPGHELGTTFVIKLPLVPDICMKLHEPPAHEIPQNAQPSSIRILLVEDHEATRNALAQLLERRQYQVMAAANVQEARAKAQDHEFDLLISDIGLPDGNGYELMKELGQAYGLIGIALTGYGMERDTDRSLAAGFGMHLTKPIHMQSLEQAISKVLSSRPNG